MVNLLFGLAVGLLVGFGIARLRYGEAFEKLNGFNNRLQVALGQERDVAEAYRDMLARCGKRGETNDVGEWDEPVFPKVHYPPTVLPIGPRKDEHDGA